MFTRRVTDVRGDGPGSIEPVRFISVRVPDELHERIRAAAEDDRRSISNWVIITLEQALDELDRRKQGDEGR